MAEAVIARKEPFTVKVEAGETYYWCACGRSKNQPFCDGSHEQVEGFEPIEFTPRRGGNVTLCACKQTKTGPYCDGSHERL